MNEHSLLFGELERSQETVPAVRSRRGVQFARRGMQALSSLALWGAILSLAALAGLDLIRLCGFPAPALPWAAKSAIPLIAIGFSYICLILTEPRAPLQRLLGASVGLAFVLWGTEQYLPDRALAASIDDLVVCLFVLDLSLVVKRSLGESAGERRLRRAGLWPVKTAAAYDFNAQPSIDKYRFFELLEGKYIDRRESIVLLGKPGTGKTHLALALGYEACVKGKQVMFTTLAALALELIEQREKGTLRSYLLRFDLLDVLIIDEIGYLPLSELGAQLIFQLISHGYEQVSFIVTSTLPLASWREVFGNEQLAEATVSRLTDRGHLLETLGDSYRKPFGV